jgi:NAD(P)-dependent dehydrogenase (short-subunit alcohol dehydrogenase family)
MLVHTVGGSAALGGGFAALTDDEWQHAPNSNLLAAVRLDRGLLALMLKQGAGVIIHISSIQRSHSPHRPRGPSTRGAGRAMVHPAPSALYVRSPAQA